MTDLAEEITEYDRELFAAAMRFCNNEQDAADLLQDTYHKALKYKDKFKRGTNLRAWLHTILRNTFINGYRRSQRFRDYVEGQNQVRTHPTTSKMSTNVLALFEASALLEDLRNHLGTPFYEVLVLCSLQDKSYKEAAALLDIPIGTVMSRLYRARKKSREYLLAHYDHELLVEHISRETLAECREEVVLDAS